MKTEQIFIDMAKGNQSNTSKLIKCEAVTCQHCKLQNYTYGYCQIKYFDIKDGGTCKTYQERQLKTK